MLKDNVDVTFSAGKGGDGKVSFKKIGRGPDGGNGGRGGDLYITTSSDLTLLNQFTRSAVRFAENGMDGTNNVKSGHKGADLTVTLPVGTELINKETGQIVVELTKVGHTFKLLNGGDGGKGNYEFRSARNTTPMKAQKGFLGEKLELTLNLKLIADFGLIGLPNSGKSSLLNELTNTRAKVANYAFTTLSPNLGVINFLPAQADKVIADIPGLIEGASSGKGLGIKFLKHIEKVKILIHCIDSTSNNYQRDYKTVMEELVRYSTEMSKKKEIILLTKSDLVNKRKKFKNATYVSIHDLEAIEKLKGLLK